MIVLAIETASTMLGVSVVADDGVLATFEARGAKRHAELLHPAIDEVLRCSGTSLAELAGIAVDVGPGLFTGLRVGVAAAKGLALACSKPLVAVTSTDALAAGAALHEGPVVPVLDVRRGEVAFEAPGGPGPVIGSIAELVAAVRDLGSSPPPLLVGTGARQHRVAIVEELGARVVIGGSELAVPSSAVLGRIAVARLFVGEGSDALVVGVRYLREADVAITWTTRLTEAAALAGER